MSNCLYQWRHAKGRIDESTIYIIIKTTCFCSSLVKSEPTRLRPKELNLWAKLHCFCVSIDTTTTCNLHEGVTTQCCFTSTETVLGTGRPGWPLRLSHSSCALTDCVQIQCWFTSTETEQTTRDWGGQDVHLDFHTAPELLQMGGNWPCFILCCHLECWLRCPFNTTFRSRWPLYHCTTWQRLLHYVKRRYAHPLRLLLLLFFFFFFKSCGALVIMSIS